MRKQEQTRRELNLINQRDSFTEKIVMGYTAHNYNGGATIPVITTLAGYGQILAKVPTFLQRSELADRPIVITRGTPILLKIQRGYAEVLSWTPDKPKALVNILAAPSWSVPDGTSTLPLYEEWVRYDPYALVDSTNHYFLIPEGWGGWWTASCSVVWEPNATGYRAIWFETSAWAGYTPARNSDYAQGLQHGQGIYADLVLAAGDYLKVVTYNTLGSAIGMYEMTVSLKFEGSI